MQDDTREPLIPHAEAKKYKPVDLRFLKAEGYLSPDFVLVSATGASTDAKPGWWGLDDIIIKYGTTATHAPSKMIGSSTWNIVPTSTLKALEDVFLDMGIPERIKVQKLPSE